MPQPIIIQFDSIGDAEIEKDLRAMAVALGKLTAEEAKSVKVTNDLIIKATELNESTASGTKSLDEQAAAYAELAKATIEVKEAQSKATEKTGEATQENETLSESISKVRTQWGKYLFVVGAIAGVVKVGTDAVKDYIEAADEEPNLFSPEQLARSKRLGDSVDGLDESFRRLKISVVDVHANALTKFATSLADGIDKSLDYEEALSGIADEAKRLRLEMLQAQGIQLFDDEDINQAEEMLTLEEHIFKTVDMHNQMSAIARGEAIESAREIAEVTASISILGTTEDLQRQTDRFNDAMDSITEKAGEKRVELANLITQGFDVEAQALERTREELLSLSSVDPGSASRARFLQDRLDGYSAEANKIVELRDELRELSETRREIADDLRKSTEEMALERAKQLLSIDGLSEAEELYLIDIGVQRGVLTQQVADDARAVIADAHSIADAFDTLDNRQVDIFINAHYSGFEGIESLFGLGVGVPGIDTPGPRSNIPTQRTTTPTQPDFDFIAQEVLNRNLIP